MWRSTGKFLCGKGFQLGYLNSFPGHVRAQGLGNEYNAWKILSDVMLNEKLKDLKAKTSVFVRQSPHQILQILIESLSLSLNLFFFLSP